jgi:hypothetical protein
MIIGLMPPLIRSGVPERSDGRRGLEEGVAKDAIGGSGAEEISCPFLKVVSVHQARADGVFVDTRIPAAKVFLVNTSIQFGLLPSTQTMRCKTWMR